MVTPVFHTGLETLSRSPPPGLRGARLGLLTHRAAVDASFRPARDVIDEVFPGQLRALWTPQHGFWGAEQDNMVETPDATDGPSGLPLRSLYAADRRPQAHLLEEIDCLVIDLQDVGTRVYTYLWTVTYCLEACARHAKPVFVLDRPNPLGGRQLEGNRLDPDFASFVGRTPIPMRHGLTLGELALVANRQLACEADVRIVPMDGWHRDSVYPPTRSWIPPSPNLPRLEGVASYPGTVLFEGTSFSEGRGTTTPFEVVGAPCVDPWQWRSAILRWDLRGVKLEPIYFTPTFQKCAGERCGGLALHVVAPEAYRPYRTALILLATARLLYREALRWREPPYEYESERLPIDIITGGSGVREAIDGGLTPEALDRLCDPDAAAWWSEARPSLLYD